MKTIAYSRFAAVAVLACLPMISQAAESDPVQRCMSEFATQNFADRVVTLKVERPATQLVPLIGTTGTRYVVLRASNRVSGHVLATANCSVRNRVMTIGEVTVAPLMAAAE